MHSWRYYRNQFLLYVVMIVLIITVVLALSKPIYWLLTGILTLLYYAFRNAFIFAHPARRFRLVREAIPLFREVTFKARDGLPLFGRFLSGKQRAVILLVHGLGASSDDMLLEAEFLSNTGYGIFMIDLRAHGFSQGDTSTYGLHEADDVAGAVDYLLTRPDVNGQKIGALGISLGAQAVLRGALQTEHIRALVLEGLGPATLADHGGRPQSLRRWINYPFNWLYYHFYHFMIGGRDKGVREVISGIAPRPILFIASGDKDIYFSRLFHQAANEPKALWEIPTGYHGAALLQDPDEYKRRVLDFFNKELDIK